MLILWNSQKHGFKRLSSAFCYLHACFYSIEFVIDAYIGHYLCFAISWFDLGSKWHAKSPSYPFGVGGIGAANDYLVSSLFLFITYNMVMFQSSWRRIAILNFYITWESFVITTVGLITQHSQLSSELRGSTSCKGKILKSQQTIKWAGLQARRSIQHVRCNFLI